MEAGRKVREGRCEQCSRTRVVATELTSGFAFSPVAQDDAVWFAHLFVSPCGQPGVVLMTRSVAVHLVEHMSGSLRAYKYVAHVLWLHYFPARSEIGEWMWCYG